MNIFVSYSQLDKELACVLRQALEKEGHTVLGNSKILAGNDFSKAIVKEMANADAIIFLITENSVKSEAFRYEILTARSLSDMGRRPLILSIVSGTNQLPNDLNMFNVIYALDGKEIEKEQRDNVSGKDYSSGRKKNPDSTLGKAAINTMQLMLATHEAQIDQSKQEQQKSEEKVKTELSNYIKDVFDGLKKSEKHNKIYALILYAVSIIALIATIIVAINFVSNSEWKPENIVPLIAYGVLSLFVIIIMISLSKLLFTLARSFMVESIRCSDRIHAISFGKFFLDAYGTEATREEVLKAFSAWNIDNGSTSFRNQSGEDFDPKIADLISVFKKTK